MTKTVHASKKGLRRVTGLVLTNDGRVSMGRERKREISAGLSPVCLRFAQRAGKSHSYADSSPLLSLLSRFSLQTLAKKYGAAA